MLRTPALLVAVIASALVIPSSADSQVRVARPRVVAARPVPRSVFVGGYYYPRLYRTSLFYGGWGYPAYYGGWAYSGFYGYGPSYFHQFPVYGAYRYDRSGSVRLQVTPREAEVFVDGSFAGMVDDFDGVFERLDVEPGNHEVQLYLAGYRQFQQRIYVQPGKTFSIKHTLEPLAPGEAAPPRPAANGAPVTSVRDDEEGGRVGRQGGGRAGREGGRGEGAGRGRQGGAPQGFGSLSLRVQPSDAEVLIDGEAWKGSLENDALVVQLGAGTHHLEIRKEGYRSYLTDLAVGNGQTRTLNVSLTKQ